MVAPPPRALASRQRHLCDDQPVVRAWLEAHALARAVHDHLLEQVKRRLFLVTDLDRLGVERLALLGIERVAGLLHEVVETLARLAADPVLAVEAVGMPDAPERAVGIEQRRLG